MDIIFKPETHEYFINGIKVPHPTGILENVGLTDFSKVPPARLEIARKFGTAVHKACELYDKGILDEAKLDPKLKPYLDAWKKFIGDTGFKNELIEEVIGSEKYMFAGTLDRRGILKGMRTIVEIKSTYDLDTKTTAIQTGAYIIAHNEMYKQQKATRRAGVLLKPDGNYKIEHFTKSNDMNVFLSCLSVANYKEVICH